MDDLIGDVIKVLERTGQLEQTLVIMTADHGGKGKSHGNPTMDEIEIPWIVRGPGVIFWGRPARPLKQYLRELAVIARLAKTGEKPE